MKRSQDDVAFLYSENAAARIITLSKLLKKSPQRLKYTLAVLEKQAIVHLPFCVFDYSYFGLLLFRVYFKGAYISEQDKKVLLETLANHDYVVSLYELHGEFDLVLEIETPNPSRFNKELRNIFVLLKTLPHYKVILNLVTYMYPRLYLISNKNLESWVPSYIIIGGDRGVAEFSDYDKAVMKILLAKPKARMTTLARESHVNIKTARSAFQRLSQKGVIKGIKYVMDTNKLGINKFRIFLKLHNMSKEREHELMEHLRKTQEVVQAHKTVGDWDLEMDMESYDKAVIRKLTIELRERFKDIIETLNIMEFYHYYKRSYLPRYLFREEASLLKP